MDNTLGPAKRWEAEHWPEMVDSAWQEKMVIQYAPLIKYIAGRLALRLPSHISLDDLISSGIIGLIDAIHKFDPSKNISFKTYAEFRIKGAILDELRSLDWIPRSVRKKSHLVENTYSALEKTLGRPAEEEEVASALGLELEKFYQLLDETKTVSLMELEGVWKAIRSNPDLPDNELPKILQDETPNPLMALQFSELQDIMIRAIDGLPDKEKLLVSLYYYEELTMKEIGQVMGYTESRISQLHTQAMYRLRAKLRKYFKDDMISQGTDENKPLQWQRNERFPPLSPQAQKDLQERLHLVSSDGLQLNIPSAEEQTLH